MNRKKVVLRALGRVVLRALIFVVKIMPLPAALSLGGMLGRLSRILSKKRYRVALKNLRIAYGDQMSDAERQRIARASFEQFGAFVVECIKFAYMSDEEVGRRVELSQYDLLQEVLSHGKGCLLITGHLGNFEIAARTVTMRGHELYALARETRDRGTTDLMRQMRERMGVKVVNINQSLKPVFAALRRNSLVAIICDQNAADVVVPFFGQPTGTVDGPARIALRTGAPMVFYACVRDGRGGYRIYGTGPCWPEPTDDLEADVVRLTTEINWRLEEMIRRNPEQWLWFHDRWKSSPGVHEPDAAPAS